MEGLDLGQTSNPSLAWKNGRFQINDDDDDEKNLYNENKNKYFWHIFG